MKISCRITPCEAGSCATRTPPGSRSTLRMMDPRVLKCIQSHCSRHSRSWRCASPRAGAPVPVRPAPPRRSHATRPTQIYRVRLGGGAETPPGAPLGQGDAIISFHGDSVICWRFAHLHGFSDATDAHIHAGTNGRSSAVVVALSTAPRLHHQGCVSVSPTLGKAIMSKPSGYYVNIHSIRYPTGAVRAQL